MKFFIFGAGYIGQRIFHKLRREDVVGFIDNNRNKQGQLVENIEIFHLDDAIIYPGECTIIIAIADYAPILEQLKQAGVTNYRLYTEVKSYLEETLCADEVEVLQKQILAQIGKDSTITCGRQIQSVCLAGYNVDDLNVGCRATSTALRDLLEETVCVGQTIYRHELLDMFALLSVEDSVVYYLAKALILYPEQIETLERKIKSCDALVINGEGTFIFNDSYREDLLRYTLLMYLCIRMNHPFYVVNAMISAGNDGFLQECHFRDVSLFLKHAAKICLRDPESVSIWKQRNAEISVQYVPDALFTTYSFYQKQDGNSFSKEQFMQQNFPADNNDIDAHLQYVVISGNSEAAHYPQKAKESYGLLIRILKKQLVDKDNVKLVLLECCAGDRFLKQIAKEERLPLIPVETEVTYIAGVLQNAVCFISGRYHPAILASLGGTPCIFMGSNSHKTRSLQQVMNYGEIKEFPALVKESDCIEMAELFEETISKPNRHVIAETAEQNCYMAQTLPVVMFGEGMML